LAVVADAVERLPVALQQVVPVVAEGVAEQPPVAEAARPAGRSGSAASQSGVKVPIRRNLRAWRK
jgi:hypothetical protein